MFFSSDIICVVRVLLTNSVDFELFFCFINLPILPAPPGSKEVADTAVPFVVHLAIVKVRDWRGVLVGTFYLRLSRGQWGFRASLRFEKYR